MVLVGIWNGGFCCFCNHLRISFLIYVPFRHCTFPNKPITKAVFKPPSLIAACLSSSIRYMGGMDIPLRGERGAVFSLIVSLPEGDLGSGLYLHPP